MDRKNTPTDKDGFPVNSHRCSFDGTNSIEQVGFAEQDPLHGIALDQYATMKRNIESVAPNKPIIFTSTVEEMDRRGGDGFAELWAKSERSPYYSIGCDPYISGRQSRLLYWFKSTRIGKFLISILKQ